MDSHCLVFDVYWDVTWVAHFLSRTMEPLDASSTAPFIQFAIHLSWRSRWVMLGDVERYRFGKEVVLRKDGDVGRCGYRGLVVEMKFVMIRKWFEVLRCQVMWRGFVDKELCWWCVGSQMDIGIVHRGMENGSMVVDELYIQRGCCTLEDFLLFSLYLFSCIVKQVTTLKQLWFWSCSDCLDMTFECHVPITISHYRYQ